MNPGQRAALRREVVEQVDEDERDEGQWFWDEYGHANRDWRE